MKPRFWISALVLLLALTGCKPELDFLEGSLRPGRAEATMSGGNVSLNFPSEAGSASVDLSASGAWTAVFVNDRAKDWCTLSTSEGKRGTATITVSVKENPDYDDRSASISFTCGDLKRTINVTQKQKDALLVTGTRFDVGQDGGKIAVEVKANIAFEYTVSQNAKDWIVPTKTKGLTTSVLNFNVLANDDTAKREGEITVKGSAGSEVVKVYQEGAAPTIVLSKNRYDVTAAGGQVRVDVQSNVDVTMVLPSDCSWVRESSTHSMSTSTYYLSVTENEAFVDRSCRILFKAAAWGLEEEVEIHQAAAEPQIIIGTGVYELGPAGGEITVEVKSNFGVTAVVPDTCAWIKAVKTKALTTRTFLFSVAENDTYEDREGSILFHNEELGITEAVVVRQTENKGLILSEKVFDIPAEGGSFEVQVQYNVDYDIEYRCQGYGFVQELKTKSLKTDVRRFSVSANEYWEPREEQILFLYDDQVDTVWVRQAGEEQYLKIVSPESRELDWEGGTLEILLEHNSYGFRDTQIYYENMTPAPVGDDYVFSGAARKATSIDPKHTRCTCPYTKNSLRRERKAYVILYNYDHSHVDTIYFTQPPVTILTSGTEVTLPQSAGTFSFRVAGTDQSLYSVDSSPYWVEQTGVSVKNGELEYQWKAAANTGRAMREGTIKIYRTDGGWPDEFLVRQEGSGLSVSVSYTTQRGQAPVIHGKYWYESVIDWGDGSSQNYVEKAKHSYASFRAYTITVTSRRMEYFDWAEVSTFQNGMLIDFSKMH